MELGNEELYYLHASSNIIPVNKSRRTGWTGLGVHVEGKGVITEFWWGYLKERDHLEDRGVSESVILKQIFKKRDWRAGIGLIWFRIKQAGGTSEKGLGST